MSDEKTPFDRNNDEDTDLVDFSSAFDEDDEEDLDIEEEDDVEEHRPATPVFKGFSFLKRKKEKTEKKPVDESAENEKSDLKTEEKTEPDTEEISFVEEAEPVEEEIPLVEEAESVEDEVPLMEDVEPIFEEIPLMEEAEPVEEESYLEEESEPISEEIPLENESVAEAVEPYKAESVGFLVEENEDDEEIIDEIKAEEKEEKPKRFKGFSFLMRKPKKQEFVVENTKEDSAGENSVDEIPAKNEETQAPAEIFIDLSEESAVVNPAKEIVIEMLPSFEETTEKVEESKRDYMFEIVEGTTEDKEEIDEIPTFEDVEEETNALAEAEEEKIKEIPTFEETIEEELEETVAEVSVEEVVEETTENEIELMPPFEETVPETVSENVEETESKKKKKEKKPKKEKKVKEKASDEQGEESSVTLMTTKDHLTFILIIVALLLTIAFIVVKFIPLNSGESQNTGATVQAKEKVAEIQLKREKAEGHYIQSDIDNVFYVYSSEYKPTFYECNGKKMSKIDSVKPLNVIVDIGNERISARVDYVELDGRIFGTGVFQKTGNQSGYSNDMVVFKLVNLPKGYEQNGKALLLATSNSGAVSTRCSMWNDSYVVDLETGNATRFLTSDNSVYASVYALLTDEAYSSENGQIPFFSTRDYDAMTNKRDIYIKTDGKETRFATDVAGSFVYTDNGVVSYLKVTDKGFNVVRKENGKETVLFSLTNDTSYIYHNEYLLDKYNGNLYNVKTGDKVALTGYGMSNPEMMTVSPDGRYLVVVGAVNSAIDYQVHIFDLETGKCAKYVDDNFSEHKNLAFINGTTFIYSAVEPKQGYEYVMLDVSKAL